MVNEPMDFGSKSWSRYRYRYPTESRSLRPGTVQGIRPAPTQDPAMIRIGRPTPP